MTAPIKANVIDLAKKAAAAHDSADAMRFSQAAVNLANAMNSLKAVEIQT